MLTKNEEKFFTINNIIIFAPTLKPFFMNWKTLISCKLILLASVSYGQNAVVRVRNNTPFPVEIVLEGTDDVYQGCTPTLPATYCSWVESSMFAVSGFSGWVTFLTPAVIECAYGWANCTFTGYGSCAGSGTTPTVGSWTTVWRNARITISPASGCSPNTACIEDNLGWGTFGGSCSTTLGIGTFTSCGNFVTWTRIGATPAGDQIDIQIY